MLLLASAAPAPAAFGFVTKWGTYGSGDGQFSEPWGVATGSSGNVYVADYFNHRIQEFSPAGTFIRKWGSFGTGDGQFKYPIAVATNSAGNVYVNGAAPGQIEEFTSTGTFIRRWETSQTGMVRGIATDSSGNVYVSEVVPISPQKDTFRIRKFTSTGVLITMWGSLGSGDGQFRNIWGVATNPAGDVYVVDAGNHRIQEFSPTGTFIRKWGSFGTGDGQFREETRGIATDSSGKVYVADSFNDRIQVFSPEGAFLGKWGHSQSEDGQFSDPNGIAINAAGDVYVADTYNERIQEFAAIPETTITGGPTEGSTIPGDKTLTFEFNSDEAGSTFNCKLDDGTFASCASPLTLTPVVDASASRASQGASASRMYQGGPQLVDLPPGPHTFQVQATNPANHVDPTPATLKFLTSSCRPGFLGFRVVASILTGWPDPQSTQCWKWDRISGKSPKPHDHCNDDSKRQGVVHLWAYNDTNLKNNPSVDVRGVRWCYQHFSKGLGNILMAYSPPGTSDYRGRRVKGWAFTGHEPPLKNRPAHFMQMYSKQNLANAPHDQWFSRRRTYRAMINVGAVGANGKELKPATLESALLKYCRESKGVGALGVGTLGVYAGSKEVHSLARARLVYRTLDKCTGGSHLGP